VISLLKSGVFFQFCKALAAVNRSVGLGFKRNPRFISAFGADSGEELSRASGGGFTRVAALLAALGLVLESALGIELLLTRGENELFSALFAN